MKRVLLFAVIAASLSAQTLDPRWLTLFHQPAGVWPTYNGDYSGRRYRDLDQIKPSNLSQLSPLWSFKVEGIPPLRGIGKPTIKSTPLMVAGVLYFTVPDHVFAIDARSGKKLWQFDWVDHGGHLLGQRGVGMYGNWLYFLTPDGWFFCLNAKDGSERWRKKVADEKLQYFTTMAPLVVKNHILVGVGGDAMDVRGYLEARDPETGDLQWRWWAEPRKPGEPGADTWPNQGAMDHGGGMTWLPGTYDPDLNLIYWGTGNANPVFAGQSRKGANLWTASIVALHADTGKLAWWFQASPHDTHDWDNVETPVLFNADIDGKPRKLLAQAARCGYFFVLDRATGKALLSKPFSGTANWSKGIDEKGQPIPDPAKEPKVDGSLIDIPIPGGTNWQPPSYDPDTQLFYVNGEEGYGMAYLYDTSDEPEGYGGGGSTTFNAGSALFALDIQTGATRWKHSIPQGQGSISGGILTTSSHLLFTGDSDSLAAFDPATGKILWHFRLADSVSNGPSTWMLDGKQYLIVGAGDTLYAFTLAAAK